MSRRAFRWPRLAVASVILAASIAAVPAATEATDSLPRLTLVDQTFVVPGASSADALSITVDGEALGPAPCVAEQDEIRVTAYRPVVTREAANEAVDDPGTPQSLVNFGLCALPRSPNGTIKLTVPTAIEPSSDPAVLRLPFAGVIPLTVELRRAGEVEALFTTFVNRLETGTDATTRVTEPMQVAVALLVDGGPTLQPDGSTAVTDGDRNAVRHALDLLGAIGEAPITIGVRPELVEGLSRSPVDGATLEELRAELTNVDLLSLPYVAIDPSAAATSGLQRQFQDSLTHGEDVLRQLIPDAQTLRLLWLFDQPVSAEGARMLRVAGVRLGALLPPQAFSLAPSDRQFEIDYGDDTLAATPVDSAIAEALAEPGDDATLTAYHLAAQVLLMRQMALDAEEGFWAPMVDHNMILSTPTGRIGNVTTTAKLVQLLASTPEVSLVAASSIRSRSIPADGEGRPYREPPPDGEIASLTGVGEELSAITTEVEAFASMLPEDDARRAAWTAAIDVAASSALDGEERSAYLDDVRGGIEGVRAAIVPPRSSRFTLGGRHSTIRLRLTNTGPVTLKVRVIISSEKLDIEPEDEDRIVTLAAGQTLEETVPVEARTNGAFPVDIELVTPGNEDVAVTDPIQVTARVNALTGLGQFATGAFLLVLLSWWVQHLRKRRRAAAATVTA